MSAEQSYFSSESYIMMDCAWAVKKIQMLIDSLDPFGNLLALKAIGAFENQKKLSLEVPQAPSTARKKIRGKIFRLQMTLGLARRKRLQIIGMQPAARWLQITYTQILVVDGTLGFTRI